MKRQTLAILVAVGALIPTLARAQAVQNVVLRNSFNPVGAGARGLGMGGAFTAVADDGSAASFNPAGLSQLRRSEITLVGFSTSLNSTVSARNADRIVDKTRHTAPDFAGLVVPFDLGGHNLAVQLSYQRAVDLFGRGRASIVQSFLLDEADPNLGSLNFVGTISPEQSGAFHTVTATTGFQVTSRLSLGASVNYWFANWTAEGRTESRIELVIPGFPPTVLPAGSVRFDQQQKLNGVNVNSGFLLRYPKVSVGGVVRLPFKGNYSLHEKDEGSVLDLSDLEGRGPVRVPIDHDFETDNRLHWPRSAGLGIAFRPVRGLTLAADYSKSQWSKAYFEELPEGALLTDRDDDANTVQFTDRNFFDLLPQSGKGRKQQTEGSATVDTAQWRTGAEYLIVLPKVVVPVRAGLYRDRSPIADLATDEGRRIKGYTLGTGLNFSRFVIDVAFERRTSEGVVGIRRQGFDASLTRDLSTEQVKEQRFVASLIYRFGTDDPIKRGLRSLFVGGGPEKSAN